MLLRGVSGKCEQKLGTPIAGFFGRAGFLKMGKQKKGIPQRMPLKFKRDMFIPVFLLIYHLLWKRP